MPSKKETLCSTCGFPVRRGKIPIIWPGLPPAGKIIVCSVDCLEAKGGIMHPQLREIHKQIEGGTSAE
jgi:hypothetical protein